MIRFELPPIYSRILGMLSLSMLSLALVACGDAGGDTPTDGAPVDGAVTADETAAENGGAVDDEVETGAADEDEDEAGSSQGMISSGTAEAPPQAPTPVEPEQAGVPRLMSLPEAVAEVPFQAYEPGFLPELTEDPVVMLIAPRTDESIEGLPAINMIYTIDARDTFRVYQSPAGDRPYPDGKESSPATVGGADGQLIRQGVTYVLGWEVDGTRLEIHSRDIPTELMQEIAEGLQPYGASNSGQ